MTTDSPYALVADFDDARAYVYANILRAHSLTPIVADDGKAAVAVMAQRGPPSLAIVELALPRIDGFGVIGQLRRQAPPSRSKVVAVSGFRNLRDAATGMRTALGIGAVMAKAAGEDSLRRVVKMLLSSRDSEIPPFETQPPPPDPAFEARRADSMRAAGLTPEHIAEPEDEVHKLVLAAAAEFSAPIALATLAFDDKLRFVAAVGLDAHETDRYSSLCNQVIEAAGPLAIADAREHPLYATNGLVRAGIIRGYASAPLIALGGQVWGTLCLIDSKKPLPLGRADIQKLCFRARRVTMALEREGTKQTFV